MKQKDILIIFILLFVVVAAWIGSNIYHSIISSTISESTNQDISPIAPTFDTKTVNILNQRKKVNPSFELESPSPTPAPNSIILPTQPVQIASEAGEITP